MLGFSEVMVKRMLSGARVKETGHSRDQIQRMAQRLREAKLWSDEVVDDREWAGADEQQMMWVIFLQAQVARGMLHRTVKGNYACYLTDEGEEVARISLPETPRPS